MPTCADCVNFRPKDDLEGYCQAAEDKLVEAGRNVEDCIAGAYEPRDQKEML